MLTQQIEMPLIEFHENHCFYYSSESDEVVNKTPPPRCAVGVASLLDHTPPPRSVTCILCQEESKDTNSRGKPFVQAAFVQRSAVLRRGEYKEQGTRHEDIPLPAHANLIQI